MSFSICLCILDAPSDATLYSSFFVFMYFRYLTLSLNLYLSSLSLQLSASIYHFLSLPLSMTFFRVVSLLVFSISLYLFLSLCFWVNLSLSCSASLSLCFSVSFPLCVTVSLPVCLSVSLSSDILAVSNFCCPCPFLFLKSGLSTGKHFFPLFSIERKRKSPHHRNLLSLTLFLELPHSHTLSLTHMHTLSISFSLPFSHTLSRQLFSSLFLPLLLQVSNLVFMHSAETISLSNFLFVCSFVGSGWKWNQKRKKERKKLFESHLSLLFTFLRLHFSSAMPFFI